MRVLVDVTHPAQVHFFKHVVHAFAAEGSAVLVTSRGKDVELALLDSLGIEHQRLSTLRRGLAGLAVELVERNARMLAVARRFRPSVMVARMGISIGLPGLLLRVPRVVFEDTEHARLQAALSLPFASRIVTGTGYEKDYGRRQVRFRGFPVMAYLAPQRFRPDPEVLRRHGLDPDAEPLLVLRTVAWTAAHDVGLRGTSADELRRVVERLSRFGRVVLSAEGGLPPDLAALANPVPVEHVHHLLALSRLFLGEGGTMAAEAAVLGTPAVYCNPLRTGYLNALATRYRLAALCDDLAAGLEVAEAWLARPDLDAEWAARRAAMLEDSEDVLAAMLRIIRQTARGAA